MSKNGHLLTDISLTVRHKEFRPVYHIQGTRQRSPDGEGIVLDMPKLTGRDNLAQAIRIRLLTPQGELSALGHPLYGSKLHEIVGNTNTENTRNLARLRILESLKNEARIKKIESVEVGPSIARRSSIDVLIKVVPIDETETVTIGPLTFDLETS